MKYTIVLPSLKTSGGTLNAIELAKEIKNNNFDVELLVLWECEKPINTTHLKVKKLSSSKTNAKLAFIHILYFIFKFIFEKENKTNYIFTHYSTLPLSLHIKNKYTIFNQGVEWEFIKTPFLNLFFEKIVIYFYKKANVITINSFLKEKLKEKGINSKIRPLWASDFFKSDSKNKKKNIDVLIFPRKGYVKRLDLYLSLIEQIKYNTKILAITPDYSIKEIFEKKGIEVLFTPTKHQIKKAYERSKIIAFLSENEGFGLPPAEAMGSGCIPICRDSGGPRSYMTGVMSEYLIPLDHNINYVSEKILTLLKNPLLLNKLSVHCAQEFNNRTSLCKKIKTTEII